MHDRPYKRRIMIVDREFQHRFIRRIAMLAVLIVVASLSLLAITYAVNLDVQTVIVQPLPLAISENAPLMEEPKTILSILLPVVIICVVVTLAVTLVFGIVISHRMAGPLFRISRELKQMEQGDLSGEIRLRKKDDFKTLARTVNNLKTNWRHRLQELSGIVYALDLNGNAEQASALNRLKEIMSSFKTD
jgi:HAMP domain-containing protein